MVRFRNPIGGSVVWDDAVKGRIEISNDELDDLVIARPDGTPTYNFCVVIDDLDMKITHVIRGDDHVNNTPRQINIIRALGGTPPVYAHLPTVLNEHGEKMSKRHGAMAVTAYRDEGYLPEAVLNYLARLGWAHGDAEIFSREQFVEWFDLEHLGKSPAQYNPEKLAWLNNHYIKVGDNARLAELTRPFIEQLGGKVQGADLVGVVALVKDRANTLKEVAQTALLFYRGEPQPDPALKAEHLTAEIVPAVRALAERLAGLAEWRREAISAELKAVLAEFGLKMPKLAMPVRLLVVGQLQTPSIDAVLELIGRDTVLRRLQAGVGA
ncbi:glutamate--tRNA ligase [Cupriavidus sp. H18C1]